MSTPNAPWQDPANLDPRAFEPIQVPKHANDEVDALVAPTTSEATPIQATEWSEPKTTEVDTKDEAKQLPWPPDVRVPTQGKPGKLAAKIFRKNQEDPNNRGFLPAPPQPDPPELEEWISEYREATTARTVAQTQAKVAQSQGGIILCLGEIGGSGTTAVLTQLATSLCLDTKADTTVYDGNHAEGCAAERLGWNEGETLTQQQLSQYRDLFANRRDEFLAQAPKSPVHGVNSVASSPIHDSTGKLIFQRNDCRECLTIAKSWCQFLFVDSMNDFTSELGLMLLEMAEVLVITANNRKQESLWKLWHMMAKIRSHGFGGKLDNHSVVVITGYPVDTNVHATFSGYLNHLRRDKDGTIEVIEKSRYEGPFMGIPHDPYIESNAPVSPDRLQWQTRQNVREVVLSVLDKLPLRRQLTPEEMEAWRNQRMQRPAPLGFKHSPMLPPVLEALKS